MKEYISKIMNGLLMVLAFGAILLLGFAMQGCEPKQSSKAGNVGSDGYYFEQAEKVILQPEITVVLVNSEREMYDIYLEKTGKPLPKGTVLEAFATIYPAAPEKCTLYMLDPRTAKYEPEFVGHEFMHCVFGQWHPAQDRKRGQ